MTPLASGYDDADYASFQRHVQARLGLRLCDYKTDQMRRRIMALAQRLGYSSFASYGAVVDRDASAREAFQSYITINVSELLRNPVRFDELQRLLLPTLIARCGQAGLSVWSAGCSYGAEACSLALLLHELAPAAPHRILGTDLDTQILERARESRFTGADIVNVSPARLSTHFVPLPDGNFAAASHLRARLRFERHDLLTDAYPSAEYDLIACRNVLIYFTEDAKERLARQFFRALRPGGLLFIGGTERLPDPHLFGFEAPLPFFYRKPLIPSPRPA